MKLSHSAVSKFQDCPKAFDYHYNQGLRSTKQSAALSFGTAVDKAIGQLLEPKNSSSYVDVFIKTWETQEVNKVDTYLPICTDIVYANTDFDDELLTAEDWRSLMKIVSDATNSPPLGSAALMQAIDKVRKEKERVGFSNLPKNDQKLFNAANWQCLYRKGIIMLESFKKKILPNIKKVYNTQEEVKLENEDGDTVVGFIDLICEYKDHEEPIVFDIKTSARQYEESAVLTSPQLSLYLHSVSDKYKTRKAGYIVFSKQILKNKEKTCSKCGNDGSGARHTTCNAIIEDQRCHGEWEIKIRPEAFIQVLVNEIPSRLEDIVLDNYDQINKAIKAGNFPRNFSSCIKYNGAVKCPFYDVCYKNDFSDVVKK